MTVMEVVTFGSWWGRAIWLSNLDIAARNGCTPGAAPSSGLGPASPATPAVPGAHAPSERALSRPFSSTIPASTAAARQQHLPAPITTIRWRSTRARSSAHVRARALAAHVWRTRARRSPCRATPSGSTRWLTWARVGELLIGKTLGLALRRLRTARSLVDHLEAAEPGRDPRPARTCASSTPICHRARTCANPACTVAPPLRRSISLAPPLLI
jgi:hypothetical protein